MDTLRYSKILIASGMPQLQAEAQAEALATIVDDKLVTKSEFKNTILELKTELLIKLSAVIGIATAILGILISFHH